MALLENLQPGNVYLVKVSASNQMGDGPFSPAVELTLGAHGQPERTGRPHSSAHATGEDANPLFTSSFPSLYLYVLFPFLSPLLSSVLFHRFCSFLLYYFPFSFCRSFLFLSSL